MGVRGVLGGLIGALRSMVPEFCGMASKYPRADVSVFVPASVPFVDVNALGTAMGISRCAVTGLEDGSVPWLDTLENVMAGNVFRLAVDGRLGVGINTGTVGDSGCVACNVVTSENDAAGIGMLTGTVCWDVMLET